MYITVTYETYVTYVCVHCILYGILLRIFATYRIALYFIALVMYSNVLESSSTYVLRQVSLVQAAQFGLPAWS